MKRGSARWLAGLALCLVTILALSCGGGGGGGSKTVGTAYSSVSRTSPLPADPEVCPFGGILIETGVDENGNGLLDASEVDKTHKACATAQPV